MSPGLEPFLYRSVCDDMNENDLSTDPVVPGIDENGQNIFTRYA